MLAAERQQPEYREQMNGEKKRRFRLLASQLG